MKDHLLLLVILLAALHTAASYSKTISCYACEWDQTSGCKKTGKVNKNYLKQNCTVCYKNVIPYKEGQAAARGSRQCLQDGDLLNAQGYTGKAECWIVNGSLHCYCMEHKCNSAPRHSANYILLVATTAVGIVFSRVT